MDKNHNNTRLIAKNTLMLYFRQILIMLVSLYTVRVVLNVLGAEDYGIYNVVAGVVTMFSFLSGAMATASQRYFSYDLGKDDREHLKITFNITFQIYLLLVFIVLIFAETLGLWFVNNKLVISHERLFAANVIFQASIVSFIMTLIATPYMAMIIAHEKMSVYAYVSIVEAVFKLAIAFLIQILIFDKLALYGILLSIISIAITGIYVFYCLRKFEECKLKFLKDKILFKEIISYSGWNLFGASVGVVKNQIMNILLNLYFGTVVNAARAIAFQISSALTSFGQNFSTAMRPQLIKSYATDQKDEVLLLVYRGCKFTFFLMYIFALPLFFEMNFVLNFWLKNPPEFSVLFTKLVLIDVLIDSLNYQIMTLAQATGKIKMYQAVVGGILLLNLPVSYFFLKVLNESAYVVFLVSIVITIVAMIVRLFIIKFLTEFSILKFILKVIFPCFVVVLVSSIVPFLISKYMGKNLINVVFTIFVCVCMAVFSIFVFGFSKDERNMVIQFLKNKFGERK